MNWLSKVKRQLTMCVCVSVAVASVYAMLASLPQVFHFARSANQKNNVHISLSLHVVALVMLSLLDLFPVLDCQGLFSSWPRRALSML